MFKSEHIEQAVKVHKAQKAEVKAEMEAARRVCAIMPLEATEKPAGEFK